MNCDIQALRHGEYVDKNGKIRRRRGSVPRCSCCGGLATVLMELGYYRDDWLILDCDACLDYVCRECCDQDEKGSVTCSLCLQTKAIRKANQ